MVENFVFFLMFWKLLYFLMIWKILTKICKIDRLSYYLLPLYTCRLLVVTLQNTSDNHIIYISIFQKIYLSRFVNCFWKKKKKTSSWSNFPYYAVLSTTHTFFSFFMNRSYTFTSFYEYKLYFHWNLKRHRIAKLSIY